MIPSAQVSKLQRALPFWLSLLLVPIIFFAATHGGWTLVLPAICAWTLFVVLDALVGLDTESADLQTTDDQLVFYRLITLIWPPVQFVTVFLLIWFSARSGDLNISEKFGLFFGVGVMTGTVGINYSHELLHQKSKLERWLADLLLASVLYSHFRSEHLLVHHRYVGTPRDAVTAKYNESFYRYFPRVLLHCSRSAFVAEKAMLTRKALTWWSAKNPFWRYCALQGAFTVFAFILGGWLGLGLFVFQAFIAVWQLELVNYIEHYGLTRKHLGDGKYEHTLPRHSWNASFRASNWLLINLQRHSDHHYKPERRYPLLQHHTQSTAPRLPYGYPLMSVLAMWPPAFRKTMNPRVRKWRKKFYPEIKDWTKYNTGTNPLPR